MSTRKDAGGAQLRFEITRLGRGPTVPVHDNPAEQPAGSTTSFIEGEIEGLLVRPLKFYHDSRGWLVELFRHDDLDPANWPKMAYASMTLPGVARGPHEHRDQTDGFGFFGPSDFRLDAWDMRPDSSTYRHHTRIVVGASNPMAVWIPPGVVHAYRNIGEVPGLVFNAPNRLYAGWGRAEPVDEIRHEDSAPGAFPME
jgi:dTDP-4-dehydrorhamnose 3,5-epimerase